jgi:hypothetical protein
MALRLGELGSGADLEVEMTARAFAHLREHGIDPDTMTGYDRAVFLAGVGAGVRALTELIADSAPDPRPPRRKRRPR